MVREYSVALRRPVVNDKLDTSLLPTSLRSGVLFEPEAGYEALESISQSDVEGWQGRARV